jgi:hypothetical protein
MLFLSAEQMQIMSREIEVLRNKVSSAQNFIIPLMSLLSLHVER